MNRWIPVFRSRSTARALPGTSEEPDCNAEEATPEGATVLVLDESGSMAEAAGKSTRVVAAQRAAEEFIARALAKGSKAVVAMAAYATTARVVSGFCDAVKADQLRSLITTLTANGDTNITEGLLTAGALFASTEVRPRRVLLLTDGNHNCGPSPLDAAIRLKGDCGVTIEVVGFGDCESDVNAELMEAIASPHPAGGSYYRFFRRPKRLVRYFQQAATRLTR